MRLLLLVLLSFVVFTSTAVAQEGVIAVFAEEQIITCDIDAPTTGLLEIYVGHMNFEGMLSQFRVGYRPLIDAGLTLLSWSVPEAFLAVGHPGTGIVISYQGCLTGTELIMRLLFFNDGHVIPDCTYLLIQPDPTATDPNGDPWGRVVAVNCNYDIVFPLGRIAIVNPVTGLCECCHGCFIPVEETTWGAIKSLYQ